MINTAKEIEKTLGGIGQIQNGISSLQSNSALTRLNGLAKIAELIAGGLG